MDHHPPDRVRGGDVLPPLKASDEHLGLEIAAVLALAVLPDMMYATLYCFEAARPWSQVTGSLAVMVRSVQVAVPTLYIMWRAGQPWSFFGMRRPRWRLDPALALLVSVLAYITAYAVEIVLWRNGVADAVAPGLEGSPFTRPISWIGWGLVVLVAIFNGFSEELVMRAYLIPRLDQLLGSPIIAVVASSLLFGSYHVYQGLNAAVGVTAMGLVYGCFFCATRRLWPLVMAHILADIVPYLT